MYMLYAFHSMFYDFNYEQLTLESIWVSPVYILFLLQKSGLYFSFLVYAAILYLWAIVTWNWVIFWYAVLQNYTLDELFNPNYYPYLCKVNIGGKAHKLEVAKDEEQYVRTGIPADVKLPEELTIKKIVSKVNPHDAGMMNNFKLFLKQSLVSQLIVK
jgi:hypothetical protein